MMSPLVCCRNLSIANKTPKRPNSGPKESNDIIMGWKGSLPELPGKLSSEYSIPKLPESVYEVEIDLFENLSN